MAKFRKRPVVIEAFPFTVPMAAALPDWLSVALRDGTAYYQGGEKPYMTIRTLEGEMRAELGDWIVRGVKGELYPCKPDIFAATYDQELAPPRSALTFDRLRQVNLTRCARWHGNGVSDWSLSDWAVAMAGEAGETCNVVKKLNRVRDGLTGNTVPDGELRDQLKEEIADTACYLDLLAAAADIDLGEAIREKFNIVSVRNGFPERL